MNEANSEADITTPSAPAKPAMSRLRAALLHLAISVVVFAAVIVPLLVLWYPPPLFFSDGGWNVIRIAFGVDIVVGPILTLVVFKAGKKGLKLDLSVIGLMQLAALVWGVNLMYQERPLFLAFAVDRFASVTEGQLADNTIPLDQLQNLDDHRPPRVFVRLPSDPEEMTKLNMQLFSDGKSPFRLTDRYQAMTPQNLQTVYSHSIDMALLFKALPQARPLYDQFLAEQKVDAGQLAFLPLQCRYEALILVLNRSDGSIAGSLHVEPPEFGHLKPTNSTGVI